MKQGTLTKKQFEKLAYDPKTGDPHGNGPKCVTCGDLAAWGMHPGCERERGTLLVWVEEEKD